MNTGLVFLCGGLRSGTSMAHLMLDSHPDIANPGEFDFFFDLLAKKGREPTVKEFATHLSTNRIFLSKNLSVDSDLNTYSDLLGSFVGQLAETDNASWLCLNIHRNFDLAHKYFPDAKYIHVVRDPRDVARSSIGMGWAGNVYYGVRHWVDTELSWQRLQPVLDSSQYVEMHFENLVCDPQKYLTGACDLLGLTFDTSMLDYHQSATYSPPDPSLVNQWKRKLGDRDIELVEGAAKDLMREFGYELVNQEPRLPGLAERVRLKVADVAYREKFWAQRYGIWLHLANRITAKLRLTPLRRPIIAKCRQVYKEYLK